MHFRKRTRPHNQKLHRVVVVQIGRPEGAAHALLVYFAKELEAIVGKLNGGPENGQRSRLNKSGRIVGPAGGQIGTALPTVQPGSKIVGVGYRSTVQDI